jgi:uncharacterized membrane protein
MRQTYVTIVPLWIRIGAIVATLGATLYLAVEDLQPFRALWLTFSSYQLGFLITWLIFLAPTGLAVWALAALLHYRRKKQDFPTATVVDRN